MTRTPAYHRLGIAALSVVVVTMLAGCTDTAQPVPPPTSAPPTPTASETVQAPAFAPQGSAADNLPVFTQVVQTVAGSPDAVSGRAYIDALVGVGFDKAAMQVTEDESTVGNPAESIQFSVRWGEECLVGQVGPATGAPVTTVMSGLASGGCLVGATRPIDW